MTATPTSRARFIKQGYQDNPETWGGELNTGALDRIDDARGQWVTKALTGNYTLTVQNYIQDEARAPMLRFTGTGSFTVTAPAVSYWYIVRNDCTGDLTLKRDGGTGVVIRAGTTAIWTTDGTTEYVLDPTLDKIKTAAANVALGGNKLTGVGTGTAATDAATLSNKVHQFAAPTSSLAMNGQKITGVGTATNPDDAATLANSINEFATPTDSLDMASEKIIDLGYPTSVTDAANLQSVRDEVAAAAAINLPSASGQDGRYLKAVYNDEQGDVLPQWSTIDWTAETSVASATTTDIGSAGSNRINITGTTTITSLGSNSNSANKTRVVRFSGALTLTHNATSLILPTGSNITTAAGDVAIFVSDGSSNWRCVSYQRADGRAVKATSTVDINNSAVTYAKIQNVSAASRLLGRGSAGGAGAPEEITLGGGLVMSGTSAIFQATLGTPVATTSGTAFDFTGIPSTARIIKVMLSELSLSGTDHFLVQIGPSGGIVTTGYVSSGSSSAAGNVSSIEGMIVLAGNAGITYSGIMTLTLANSTTNLWIASYAGGSSSASATSYGGGSLALAGPLTQLRVTRTGTNTFDAGNLNILYY